MKIVIIIMLLLISPNAIADEIKVLRLDKEDKQIENLLLKVPKISEEREYWKNKYKDDYDSYVNILELKIYDRKEMDIDSNDKKDFLVYARYLDLCAAEGDDRCIIAIIKDLEKVVFTDYAMCFSDVILMSDLIKGHLVLSYQTVLYARIDAGFWDRNFVDIISGKELLSLSFSTAYIGQCDLDEFKYIDINGDGNKEILLKHNIWFPNLEVEYDDYCNRKPDSIKYSAFCYNSANSKFHEIKTAKTDDDFKEYWENEDLK